MIYDSWCNFDRFNLFLASKLNSTLFILRMQNVKIVNSGRVDNSDSDALLLAELRGFQILIVSWIH